MALRIGQLAEQARVKVETVRFYERRGLIAEPERTPAGYRQYSVDTVRRIRFIKRAQDCNERRKQHQEGKEHGANAAAQVYDQLPQVAEDEYDCKIPPHDVLSLHVSLRRTLLR